MSGLLAWMDASAFPSSRKRVKNAGSLLRSTAVNNVTSSTGPVGFDVDMSNSDRLEQRQRPPFWIIRAPESISGPRAWWTVINVVDEDRTLALRGPRVLFCLGIRPRARRILPLRAIAA